MDKQLKPCPFCGAEVKKIKSPLYGMQMFLCNQCGATVSFYESEDDLKATKAWNRRVNNKKISEARDERKET